MGSFLPRYSIPEPKKEVLSIRHYRRVKVPPKQEEEVSLGTEPWYLTTPRVQETCWSAGQLLEGWKIPQSLIFLPSSFFLFVLHSLLPWHCDMDGKCSEKGGAPCLLY